MDNQYLIDRLEESTGIKIIPVDSSVLICYGVYKKPSEITLILLFKFGKDSLRGNCASKYRITESELVEFEKASSKGKWVNDNLIKKSREYVKYYF